MDILIKRSNASRETTEEVPRKVLTYSIPFHGSTTSIVHERRLQGIEEIESKLTLYKDAEITNCFFTPS